MAENEVVNTEVTEETVQTTEENAGATDTTEIARLRAEQAKLKSALDKATKEAAENRRALRARQTAEEQAAEDAKAQQEAIAKELAELRKEKAVATTSKRVFAFVQDENTSNSIAEALYGAEDVDLAIDTLQKAWVAKEKALRLEYGKIPAPGIGSADGPTITKAELDGMGYKDRLEFSRKYPEQYQKLMGR